MARSTNSKHNACPLLYDLQYYSNYVSGSALDGTQAYKLAQWRGDAALALGVRTLVAELYPDWQLAKMALLASVSVNNATLTRFFDEEGLERWRKPRPGMKGKADEVEALLWMLHVSSARDRYAAELQRRIWRKLIDIGHVCVEERQLQTSWLGQWACERNEVYTHSSLRGGKDFHTATGRLSIPDDPAVRQELYAHIVDCFSRAKPLCWVEMCTQSYPFFEDIDVMGSECEEKGDLDDILSYSKEFWITRAELLHQLFPDTEPLRLTLFTASGWNAEKKRHKSSFHAVWPQLVVTKERANIIRKCTVSEFEKLSGRCGPLFDVKNKLLDASECNVWESVFDISSVRGGSFRMPYNDKINKGSGRTEGRPILPEGVWRFHFTEFGKVARYEKVYEPDDLGYVEWLERGRVRLRKDESDLTPWKPPVKASCWLSPYKLQRGQASGSCCDRQTRLAEKAKKKQEMWQQEQARRRRHWSGTAAAFKTEIDNHLDDPEGHASTLLQIKAKQGKSRWLWTNRRVKGAIEIQEPDGEVFVRGNQEQQLYLIEFLKEFTQEWTEPLRGLSKPKSSRANSSSWWGSTWRDSTSQSWSSHSWR